MKVGILAFQGDFSLHKKILNKLNVDSHYVRNVEDLSLSDALIIPGGESTVISKMIMLNKLNKPLQTYSLSKSIYGTCAGAIVMSSKITDPIVKPLKIIDVEVYRNSPRCHNVFTIGSLKIISPIVAGMVINKISLMLKLRVCTNSLVSPFAA